MQRQHGGAITGQLRRLGASCDWSRERFTLDSGLSGEGTEWDRGIWYISECMADVHSHTVVEKRSLDCLHRSRSRDELSHGILWLMHLGSSYPAKECAPTALLTAELESVQEHTCVSTLLLLLRQQTSPMRSLHRAAQMR